jgi:hypothetical protein
MRQEQDRRERGRRGFLRLAGLGAGAAVAAAVAGREAQAALAEPEVRGQGYRETAHVRKYYELARF